MTARLAFSMATKFQFTCHTQDSKKEFDKRHAAFFTADDLNGYSILGDCGQVYFDGEKNFFGSALVVKEIDPGNDPILKPPIDATVIFSKTFDEKNRRGYTFWYPVPPPGYVSIGTLTSILPKDTPPGFKNYRCIRADKIINGALTPTDIWRSDAIEGDLKGYTVTVWGLATTGVILAWPGRKPIANIDPPTSIPTSPVWQPLGFPV